MNAADFDQALQHFQTIGVAQKAYETGSHGVANRIHSVIMQKFTSSIDEGSSSTPQYVQPAIQKGTTSGNNSTDDGEMLEDDESTVDSHSTNGDATSSCTSLDIPGQEHPGQVGGRSENPMVIDDAQQSHHLTSALTAETSNGMSPSLGSLRPKLTKKQCVLFQGWTPYPKQRN